MSKRISVIEYDGELMKESDFNDYLKDNFTYGLNNLFDEYCVDERIDCSDLLYITTKERDRIIEDFRGWLECNYANHFEIEVEDADILGIF